MALSWRGRRRAESGAAPRWARPRGHRGQAARRRRAHPLGSTRAGEGASDGAMAARSAVLARGCSVAAVIAAAEKRERAKREKGQEPNELGFQAPARRRGFYPSDGNGRPSDHTDGADSPGRPFSPGGCARQAEFPAQAQVAAWARGSARERAQTAVGRGPFLMLWAETVNHEPSFVFSFS